jgi:hypothetical protein
LEFLNVNERIAEGNVIFFITITVFSVFQGYEGSLLKVTSKNGKTASVSFVDLL